MKKHVEAKKRKSFDIRRIVIVVLSILLAVALFFAGFLFVRHNQADIDKNGTNVTNDQSDAIGAINNFSSDIDNFIYGSASEKSAQEIESEILTYINDNQSENPDSAAIAAIQLTRLYDNTEGPQKSINFLEQRLDITTSNMGKYYILDKLITYYENDGNIDKEKTAIKQLLALDVDNLEGESWYAIQMYYENKLTSLEQK